MPEGPSLVIAREEMSPAIGKKVLDVSGNTHEPVAVLQGQKLLDIGTWGKHLLLFFPKHVLRIHFMLWGSYSVDELKETRKVRLSLKFPNTVLYFYACSVKFLEDDVEKLYDWSADVMSPAWDERQALKKIKEKPNEMVCDILMDQNIFSGVGNIIKNEALFNLRLHPERKVKTLTDKQLREFVFEAEDYTWKFYEWKKSFELKKHWQVMRKKTCPICKGPVTRRPTGKGKRLSHYCDHCQK